MLRNLINNETDYHEFVGVLAKLSQSKTIVEIGVQHGVAALKLADAAKSNNGKYFGYDIWEDIGVYKKPCDLEDVSNELIKSGFDSSVFKLTKINSRFPEFQDVLRKDTNSSIDFAFIDADHSYLGCKNDFEKVYPLLSEEGIMILHDTYSHSGCRNFVLDLYTKYNDGTFDIINLPYGGGSYRFGLTVLVKRIYPLYKEGITIEIHEENGLTKDDVYNRESIWFENVKAGSNVKNDL